MDSKKDDQYMFTCRTCKHRHIPWAVDKYQIEYCCCHHPAVKKMGFSSDDYTKFKGDDWDKLERLAHDILKLKINSLSVVCNACLGFPSMYDPVWVEGCESYEKK